MPQLWILSLKKLPIPLYIDKLMQLSKDSRDGALRKMRGDSLSTMTVRWLLTQTT